MDNAAYYEEQKFRQPWLLVIIYLAIAISLVTGLVLIINKSVTLVTILPLIVSVALWALFKRMKLMTWIDAENISYMFYPFHLKKQIIAKTDIKDLSVIKYNPILEYGGWGLRAGANGRAYTVSGNRGLRIQLHSNRKLLIGTAKPNELSAYLQAHNWIEDIITTL